MTRLQSAGITVNTML